MALGSGPTEHPRPGDRTPAVSGCAAPPRRVHTLSVIDYYYFDCAGALLRHLGNSLIAEHGRSSIAQGSSCPMACGILVNCLGRQVFNLWTTREVPPLCILESCPSLIPGDSVGQVPSFQFIVPMTRPAYPRSSTSWLNLTDQEWADDPNSSCMGYSLELYISTLRKRNFLFPLMLPRWHDTSLKLRWPPQGTAIDHQSRIGWGEHLGR